jgi:guanylate kinase
MWSDWRELDQAPSPTLEAGRRPKDGREFVILPRHPVIPSEPMASDRAPQEDSLVAELNWTGLSGKLVVLSGASGAGKSTLVRRLLERPDLRLIVSVSATTRAPRPGEIGGRDYIFLSAREFKEIRDDLLEFAEVHGHSYGTPAEPVRRAMAQGRCVILVIDVQGGLQVRQKVPGALLVFVQTPGLDVLEARLRARGTDDEAAIQRRLANARRELELARHYDIQVINNELERSVSELERILVQNGCGGRIEYDR